jgi:hypothetical protein
MVTDNITGLTWQGCSAGQRGEGCSGIAEAMSWMAALPYCDALDWGGHVDWYLPDEFELQSILDYGRTSPAIDESSFPNTPAERWWDDWFWSSSLHAVFSDQAWTVHSASADIFGEDKDEVGYVRCARGALPSVQVRFERTERVAEQPVVEDNVTSLMWQGCSAGQRGNDCAADAAEIYDWEESLAYCESLAWSGHSDWRLPDIRELRSIVDNRRADPAVDPAVFPNTPFSRMDWPHGRVWSSTPRGYRNFGLYVGFLDGNAHFYEMAEQRRVRCVRDVRLSPPEPTSETPTPTASATAMLTASATAMPTASATAMPTETRTSTPTPGGQTQPHLYMPKVQNRPLAQGGGGARCMIGLSVDLRVVTALRLPGSDATPYWSSSRCTFGCRVTGASVTLLRD